MQTVTMCYSQQLIYDVYDNNIKSDRLSLSLCQSSLLAAGQQTGQVQMKDSSHTNMPEKHKAVCVKSDRKKLLHVLLAL